jgi:RES domain-containing protein
MDLAEARLSQRLGRVRPVRINSVWASATPFVELCRHDPPDWLFCSCEPKRYNPKNVACIYFADGGRTARAEHACNEENELQPIVFFSAKVSIRSALDLTNSKNLKTLGLARDHLFEDWERKKKTSVTQLLGSVIAKDVRFSAIVFPSAAAHEAGFHGKNIVIFRDSVRKPDFVHVLGPSKKPLQRWPEK